MRYALVRDLEADPDTFDMIAIEHKDGTRTFTDDNKEDAERNAQRKSRAVAYRKEQMEEPDFILDFRSTYRAFLLGDYQKHKEKVDTLIRQRFGYTQKEIEDALR